MTSGSQEKEPKTALTVSEIRKRIASGKSIPLFTVCTSESETEDQLMCGSPANSKQGEREGL